MTHRDGAAVVQPQRHCTAELIWPGRLIPLCRLCTSTCFNIRCSPACLPGPSQPRARSCTASSGAIRSQRAPARAGWGATWVRAIGLVRPRIGAARCTACCSALHGVAVGCHSLRSSAAVTTTVADASHETVPKAPTEHAPGMPAAPKLANSMAPVCCAPADVGGVGDFGPVSDKVDFHLRGGSEKIEHRVP